MGKRSSDANRIRINPELEPAIAALAKDACEGGDPLLARFASFTDLAETPGALQQYLAAVHQGFDRAQDAIYGRLGVIDRIESGPQSDYARGEAALLRAVADSIAWQLIGRELYFARRLYKGEKPPKLSEANSQTVHQVAKTIIGDTYEAFALMSDLTSFVQIGDILATGRRESHLEVIEVKEGAANEKVLNFLAFMREAQCARALYHFRLNEGEKTFEQLKRVVRQEDRMAALAQLINKGQGEDPDSQLPLRVVEASQPITLYDDRLERLIIQSEERGWAIETVDGDCLFLAAYRGRMAQGSEIIFRGWFEAAGAGDSPVTSFSSSLLHPLALPPFARMINRAAALDVVFGRCRVWMGLHVPNFAKRIQAEGVNVRAATRREVAQMSRGGKGALLLNGKPIVVEKDQTTSLLHDGLAFRVMFHGMTPYSAARLATQFPDSDPHDKRQ